MSENVSETLTPLLTAILTCFAACGVAVEKASDNNHPCLLGGGKILRKGRKTIVWGVLGEAPGFEKPIEVFVEINEDGEPKITFSGGNPDRSEGVPNYWSCHLEVDPIVDRMEIHPQDGSGEDFFGDVVLREWVPKAAAYFNR